MKYDIEMKNKITKILEEKRALQPCQRCGHTHFSLLDGFANLPIHQEISGNIIIGGPTIPCILTVCNNCGNLNFHATGALGLNPIGKGGENGK